MQRRSAETLAEALEALSAVELRAFVVDSLARLDDGTRTVLEDALLRQAARGIAGWKPPPPSASVVKEATSFGAAARQVGQADPSQVDHYLRQAVTASLAGDPQAARAIFQALLAPIADAEIDLGQHELVEEVLSADLRDCTARYLAATYATTPSAERAEAVLVATTHVHGLSYLEDPVESIVSVLGGTPPDLPVFLSAWIDHLEREVQPSSRWETDEDRWPRAAVGRRDGIAGLERLARATKRSESARAWCAAVVESGVWTSALAACETSAELVGTDPSCGEFLDGAARAAYVLGSRDLLKKLEAAWTGAPSLLRLVRWLLAGEPSTSAVRRRATDALAAKAIKAPRLVGFLHVLVGEIGRAARLLEKAPALGWSRSEHPGHILFPVFAWLLGDSQCGFVRENLTEVLHQPLREEFDFEQGLLGDSKGLETPTLPTPTIVEALVRSDVAPHLTRDDRARMLAGMKVAATRRTDGLLGEKRRRHYGHAAALIACCVELEDGRGRPNAMSAWAEGVRSRTTRFPAFQEELRAALAGTR